VSKGSSGGGAGISDSSAGTGPVRESGGISYQKSPQAAAFGDVAVEVSVSKLNDAWQNDIGYIGRGGRGGIQDPGAEQSRYERAKSFIDRGNTIDMPQVTYDPKRNRVVFNDGRHRAAVIRDKGKTTMWVTVPRGQARQAKSALGP